MKKRSSPTAAGHGSEFKGVVKKIAGKLTNDPGLEREGRAEMMGGARIKSTPETKARRRLNPDPHRRG